jgi:hypothetical protein
MTDMTGSEPDPTAPRDAGAAGGAGGWTSGPGSSADAQAAARASASGGRPGGWGDDRPPEVAAWGNEPTRDSVGGGGLRGDGLWPGFAALIAVLLGATGVTTWLDIGNSFGGREWTFALSVFVAQGLVAVIVQLACAAVARGNARRTAAAFCMGTSAVVVAGALLRMTSGTGNLGGGNGAWSTRLTYLSEAVMVLAVGLIARRLTREE